MIPTELPPPDDRLAAAFLSAEDALTQGAVDLQPPPDLPSTARVRLERSVPTLKLLQQAFGRRPRASDPPPARNAERYAFQELHAMGGVGEVWLARDTLLGREVALKELRPDRAAHGGLHERLLQEARVTSRLQHPGIVPVYELVEAPAAGDAFFTMRFVRGRTLAAAARAAHARADRGDRAVEVLALLSAFVSVCHTVAYAHTRGVIHRDLKTENVLLGDFGEVVVIDWGFAKVRGAPDEPATDDPAPDAKPGETLAGTTLGTPAYMAPEQAGGGPVTERADVYGLGAILYEVLTGRPPYLGENAADVLTAVRTGPPPRPESVAAGVPPGLAAVCRTAMARDPNGRYATPAALARDVQRWLADEPPTAYREPPLPRLARFARRHRTAVVAAVVLVVAAATGAAALFAAKTRAAVAMADADARARDELTLEQARTAEEHAHAVRQRAVAERQRYLFLVGRADRELRNNSSALAGRLLNQCPPDARGWEWRCLHRLTRAEPLVLRGHTDGVRAVAFRPGHPELASAGFEHTVRVWDLATGTARLTLAGHTDFVSDVAYSPDGTRLATGGWDGRVLVRDPADGRVLHTLETGRGAVTRLAFSPDGRRLVARTGGLTGWDVATGRALEVNPRKYATGAVAFGPDGHLWAAVARDGHFTLTDLDDDRAVAELPDMRSSVRWEGLNPAGTALAWTGGSHWHTGGDAVSLYDLTTGAAPRRLAGHTDLAVGVAFSPDGRRLASAGMDHTVRVWDPAAGDEVLTLVGHTNAVRCVGFSPDGRWLASGGDDRTVRVWDAAPVADLPPRYQLWVGRHPDNVTGVAWAGDTVASVGADGTLRVWDPAAGSETAKYPVPLDSPAALACSPDGGRLAVAALTAVVIDRRTGRVTAELPRHRFGHLLGVAFSPDGSRVATVGWDRTVQVANPADGTVALSLTGHTGPVGGVTFSPDGKQIATAGWDETVRVWDARSGTPVRTLTGLGGRGGTIAYSPDGRTVAAAGKDGAVQLWDAATGRPTATLHGHGAAVNALAFRHDGGLLGTASADATVRLWRLGAGAPTEVRVLRGHDDQVRAVAFSPDGLRLVTGGADGTVRVWDAAVEAN